MTDAQVQRKLNQLVQICNELDAEAKRRYGPQGNLYYESGGTFCLMSGPSHDENNDSVINSNQHLIEFESKNPCNLGAGAW